MIYSVQKSFGYRAFHKVGANIEMQSMFKTSLVCESLLKIDSMIAFLLMLMAYLFLNSWSNRSVISICAAVFTISWSFVLFGAIRKEDKCMTCLVFGTCFVQPGYIIWKLIDLKLNPGSYSINIEINHFAEFIGIGALYIIVRILLLYYIFKVYKIFGKGLRNRVFLRSTYDNMSYNEPSYEKLSQHDEEESPNV